MESTYTFDENIVSDLYKEAYGFRPREYFWSEWEEATNDRKQAIWDDLLDTADREAEREREMQIEAEHDVEDRIRFMMSTVAGCTREDAIRYLHDAYNTNGDTEYLEFNLGVRYGYLSGSLKVGF
jgi:hypothetical protein